MLDNLVKLATLALAANTLIDAAIERRRKRKQDEQENALEKRVAKLEERVKE